MQLAIASDLHFEFNQIIELNNENNADILILAGDIIPVIDLDSNNNFNIFIKNISKEFKNIIYIAGNHEHYGYNFKNTITTLKSFFKEYNNIHILEKEILIIDNIVFVCGTLWTNMNNADPLTIIDAQFKIKDAKFINNGNSKLSPYHTIDEYKQTIKFIQNTINLDSNKRYVVVTHHAPSKLSIPDYYKYDYHFNGSFISNLDNFIYTHPQIKLWIHGHTHQQFDYMINKTRIICNPYGYEFLKEIPIFNLKYITI